MQSALWVDAPAAIPPSPTQNAAPDAARLMPKEDLERYIREHVTQWSLPEWPQKLHVGPFDTGVFLRGDGPGGLQGVSGQWGMTRPGQRGRIEYREYPAKKAGAKPRREPMLKNNARMETVAKSPAFKDAWAQGRRCLVPAEWLQEPNWETGKCVWWHLRRADGLPWMIAGIWSEWTDFETGELVPNYAMLTFNVDEHPLLNRRHKPERDRATGEVLPPHQQDKRGEAHIDPKDWATWLTGTVEAALGLLNAPSVEAFDLSDARTMDGLLGR